MKVAVLYNEPVAGKPDSEDILDEVNFVIRSLAGLGYEHRLFPLGGAAAADGSGAAREVKKPGLSLNETIFYLIFNLKKYRPDVIFNLVEGVNDAPVYQQFFALLLEHLRYPFTGCGFESMVTTSDKGLSKTLMGGFNIVSPAFCEYRGVKEEITIPGPWIVKPALEDASIGIDETSVFHEPATLRFALPSIYDRHGRQPLIIEQFIRGREFNVSLMEKPGGTVEVLPVAEIVFHEWPEEVPMIVGYKAKWDRKSFEYTHTSRRFEPGDVRVDLLRSTALQCWKAFKLKGYARVDMRVAEDGRAYVLEANANPCISPDAGYVAALKEAGYSGADFVQTMIEVAVGG